MTDIQERLLESKMAEIERARSWSPRVISKFETLIGSGDDLSLPGMRSQCLKLLFAR
ncbi:hypothetical protein [Bradyrhizobium sp. TM233]|uniref:hypothetical protein n=1 Tax=Bradyrhizobium sp. TM233 TaxID=2599801 RepID=UPI0027D57A02|nr:hypothetical protein TM233_20190 [Bradyrhizobium sp. TM233]